MLCNQRESVVGKSSKPPMESTVISMMLEASTAGISSISSLDQASELLASNPTRVLGVPETRKVSASKSSSAAVALDSDKVVSSLSTVSDAKVTHGLGNRDSGFTGDMVVSSMTAAIEVPILKVVLSILGQYPWVVQNRFSPFSNLGNGVDDVFREG